jgi:hypothetical protein
VKIRLLAALAACVLLPSIAYAESPSMTLAQQIDHLIGFIEESPCGFIRNGTEYDGAAAADHVRQKYVYYRDRDRIHSVEDFIDLAATKSALSGKPYQIRCPGQPVRPAAAWLRAELQSLRAKAGGN